MTDFERIEKVIRYLEKNHQAQPKLEALAKIAGLSESHFHRLFSRWAGTTPKEFLKFLTAAHAKSLLEKSEDVLSVSGKVGLSGPGRLHDLMISLEGMSPGEYKSGGRGLEIQWGVHDTPFGECLIASTKRGICHLSFVGPQSEKFILEELKERWPNAEFSRNQKATAALVKAAFGKGKRELSLLVAGTPFQIKVWEALLKIPTGGLMSYGDLASFIGHPRASRAVGTAVGSNEISYLIPCHRVIRDTGVIGHYRWGSSRKRALLAWEFAHS